MVAAVLVEATLVTAGIVVLYVAAEGLVRGAADLSAGLGVTPVVIGLTVVAFGTSAPEMVIGAVASLEQAQGIALGNVVGSNIANVGLILGVAALLSPLSASSAEIRREISGVLASAGLLIVLALDGAVGRLDGAVLVVAMAAFLGYSYYAATRGRHTAEVPALQDVPEGGETRRRSAAMVVVGLGGVALGAWMTVEGATGLAVRLGVAPIVIGLTVVALGTSLPELATSAVASYRRQTDISVGNVIGSNLFNTLAVLGIAALIAPVPVGEDALVVGLPVMVAFSLALVPLAREDFVLVRWHGAGLLAGFVVFWAYLAVTGAQWVS